MSCTVRFMALRSAIEYDFADRWAFSALDNVTDGPERFASGFGVVGQIFAGFPRRAVGNNHHVRWRVI